MFHGDAEDPDIFNCPGFLEPLGVNVGAEADLIFGDQPMKKTLLAAAALVAMSGSAFAQSSLTIYGVLDASLENVKQETSVSTKAVTRVSSDNLATSRLGFKGIEDLGGGLKAIFALEHNVKVDTGAQGNGPRFWDRAAWVGLSGGFGEVKLGRMDSAIGAMMGNTAILGAQGYDDLRIANTYASNKYRRFDNAISYSLPALVTGLAAQIQYTTGAGTPTVPGAEAPNNDLGKGYSASAQYTAGPIGLGAAYFSAKATAATNSYKDSAALAFASYDFGAAKLTGYYDVDSGGEQRLKVMGLKVGVPITADFSLTAGVSRVKNAAKLSASDDATILALKGVYDLSKRTALYALFTTVKNGENANLIVAPSNALATGMADKSSRGLAIGVRHAF